MQGSSDRNASPVPSDMSTTTTSTQLSHSFGMQTSELTMFQQRCSICFEAQLDFCLERCRDQFCRECFSRYVSETIGSAWGMATPKVKCPVCSDPLAREDWAKVSELILVTIDYELHSLLNMKLLNRSIAETTPSSVWFEVAPSAPRKHMPWSISKVRGKIAKDFSIKFMIC